MSEGQHFERVLERLDAGQLALRRRVEDAVAEVSPLGRGLELDRLKAFDSALHDRLALLGVFRLGTPEADGGLGGGPVAQVVVLETLGRLATSMAVFCIVRFLVVRMLRSYGSGEQKAAHLAALLAGTAQAAFCLTEIGGGTDILATTQTSATRRGDEWILRGSKVWISGAASSELLFVVARTDAHRTKGLSVFLVPTAARGVSTERTATVALNGYETCSVVFEDVVVGAGALLGAANTGLAQLMSALNGERINAAAVVNGIARGALGAALEHARQRTAFAKPIGQFQAVQHRLASVAVAIEMAWLAVLEAARRDAAGEATDIVSGLAKWASSKAALGATDLGMELMGAAGFLEQGVMQRYFRDARLHVFAPINNDMILNLLGERWLGLPRSF